MPLIETKGAASAQGFGEFTQTSEAVYIESCFSTYLYTGNGSTQTITNGIDLSGKGGLVWMKSRSAATDHALYDTVRGATKDLVSNSTAAETTQSTGLTSFASTGFSIGALAKINTNAATYVSWTFREQPKFFDVVTYTGDGASSQVINHSLNSVPGGILIKRLDSTSNWPFWRLDSSGNYRDGYLNLTDQSYNTVDASTLGLTSTTFNAGKITQYDGFGGNYNANGATYVAYLFAHNAGGFGLTGSDNVISCGSYTTDSSGNATINLGYEPQFLLVKRSDSSSNWILMDVMRGQSQTNSNPLYADLSSAEASYSVGYFPPTATGFKCNAGLGTGVQTHIYIAIRRGPMKVPTSGTSVFMPLTRTGTGASATVSGVGFPPDLVMPIGRSPAGYGDNPIDRLRGNSVFLKTYSTAAEVTDAAALPAWTMDGFTVGASGTTNDSGVTYVYENFRRAPSFFDEVCYTGTGSATTQAHNLGVAPELMIIKSRGTAGTNWAVYSRFTSTTYGYQTLQTDNAGLSGRAYGPGGSPNFEELSAAPTATVINLASSAESNANGRTFVAYLFATCAGVSKVGSYTGTGALQTVNCGFTGGARFVLIKRTDSTGDWYVYDSARGISASNDPYLLMNSTAAEVTGTNYVDTTSVGFQVTAAAPAGLNANGGSFVFLAIA